MRKITSLLTLLLCFFVGTAWAQVEWPELTTDPSNPKLYQIQSYRSYRFVQYASDAEKPTQTFDFTDASTKFYFVPVNGTDYTDGVKIVSNVNGKQINEMSGFAETGTSWFLTESTFATGCFNIGNSSTMSDCWDCSSAGVMTANYWNPNTEGSTWQIVSVPQYETSTLANPKWYYLKTGRGNYVYANGTNAGATTNNPKTDDYRFAFISVGGTGVNIVSKTGLDNGSNQYLTTTPGLSSTADTWYNFNAARYPGYFMFSDDASGYGYPHLLNDNGNGGLAKWYIDSSPGSYFQVEEVPCEVTYTYTYGGTTYSETVEQKMGTPVSLPASITKPYTNYSFDKEVVPNALTATVNVTVEGFSLPFTASTDFNNATWYYATLRGKQARADEDHKDSSGRYQTNSTNAKTNEYKWAFIGNPYTNFYVINKGQGEGKYLYADEVPTMQTVADPSSTSAAQWAITPNSNGGFTLRSVTGATLYINDAGNGGNIGYWNSTNGANDGGSNWVVEEALPVCEVTYTYTFNGNTYSSTELQNIGAPVSLPADINFPYTNYTFSESVVPDNGVATINVTVAGFTTPFTLSTDYASATWYYLNGHAYYDRAYFISTNGDAIDFKTGRSRNDAYKWAFIGNPIEGIKVINKAAGNTKYINATNPATMGTTAKAWELKQQTDLTYYSGTTGFGLYDSSLGYVNCRTGSNDLQYWSMFDTGSTFWVEDVDATTSDKNALAATITAAQALVDGAGVPGYPTTSAASTLSSAVTAAQTVYDNPSGDYASAYNTLVAAINTASANIEYTPRTDVYYTIVNARGAMVYDPSHSSSVDATNNDAEYVWYGSSTPDDTDENNLWGFIYQDGHYYMYNVGKEQFATVGTGGYGPTWIFSDTPAYITLDDGIADEIACPKVRVRATIATTGQSYTMSVSTGYTGPVITYDANGDGGVPMLFAESSTSVDASITAIMEAKVEDLTPYRNALQGAVDQLTSTISSATSVSYPLGSALGQYTQANGLAEYVAPYQTAITEATTLINDNTATKDDLTAKYEEITTKNSSFASGYKAFFTLNQPTAGMFLRIKTAPAWATTNATAFSNTQPYLIGSNHNEQINETTRAAFSTTAGNANSSVWYLTETSGTKYLVSYSSGYPAVNNNTFLGVGTGTQYLSTNGTSIVFEEAANGEVGTYNVKFATNRYLYTNAGLYTDAAGSANGAGYNFQLEEVTSIPVTVSSAGYASLYLPVAVEIPSGVLAYAARVDNNLLRFTQITSIIPAETPVVIEAEAGTYNLAITSESGTAVEEGKNVLAGCVAAEACEAEANYTLQKPSGKGIGFYLYTGTKLGGFKAYLPGSAVTGLSIRGFAFEDAFNDVTTDVGTLPTVPADVPVYDLQGRKVASPIRGGIYIVGGRKVIVK